VPLDGTASFDCDGDPFTYFWTTDCPGTFDDPTSPTPVLTVQGATCGTSCNVTVAATDSFGNQDTDVTTVTVQDTQPPEARVVFAPVPPLQPTTPTSQCTAPAARTFRVSCEGVTDSCDPNPTVSLVYVFVVNHINYFGACVERWDAREVQCNELVDVVLLPLPCREFGRTRFPPQIFRNSAGRYVFTGSQVLLNGVASDFCGNSATTMYDPAVEPSPACEQVLPSGVCCPSIARPASRCKTTPCGG
jgi:hypothetical protein